MTISTFSRSIVFTILLLGFYHNSVAATVRSKTSHVRSTLTATENLLSLQASSEKSSTELLREAIEHSIKSGLRVLRLKPGTYHFYPQDALELEYFISNTNNQKPRRKIPILIKDAQHFTLDGNGAKFIFHGEVTPLVIEGGRNVTIKNLSIDWDRPFASQLEVIATNENYIDFRIDRERFPYAIKDHRLSFTGEGWTYPPGLHVIVNYRNEIEAGKLDDPLGEEFFKGYAEEISANTFRIKAKAESLVTPGTRIVIRHGRGDNVGLFLYKTKDVRLEHLTFYHAPGKAILGQRCDGVKLKHSSIAIAAERDRWFSSYADAMHFSGCRGTIHISHANNTGQLDDWLNVHGTYTSIEETLSGHEFIGKFHHHESQNLMLFAPGDNIAILDHHTGKRLATAVVAAFELLPPNSYRLRVTEDRSAHLKQGYIIENLSWTPSLIVEHSIVGKQNRARSLLITTPQKVLIQNNLFSSAGSPILIEGDFSQWYESGAVKKVEIRHNRFEGTFSSGVVKSRPANQDGEYYWGDASVLSVTPSFKTKPSHANDFHQHIHVHHNRIATPHLPWIYATAVDDLRFTDNVIETVPKTDTAANPAFFFDASTKISISNNHVKEKRLMTLNYTHMSAKDIRSDGRIQIRPATPTSKGLEKNPP